MFKEDVFTDLNKLLVKHSLKLKNYDILNGKMGIAMYFFHLNRYMKNSMYKNVAEKLLDGVVKQLSSSIFPYNFSEGLAGIIWGMEYLEKMGFICTGDTDVFKEVDDRIFKYIIDSTEMSLGLSGYSGYLLYFISRIENPNNTSVRYQKRLIIELVNRLYHALVQSSFLEPMVFNLLWDLPLVLFVLAKISKINIYNNKILYIINELSHRVLSIYPNKNYNKLLLFLGMSSILKNYYLPKWKVHKELLEKDISIAQIINEELNNKALTVRNGIAGIVLLDSVFSFFDIFNLKQISHKELEYRIIFSDYWKSVNSDSLGIMDGYAGIGLSLLNIKEK